jgi:hypothetical protein
VPKTNDIFVDHQESISFILFALLGWQRANPPKDKTYKIRPLKKHVVGCLASISPVGGLW